MADTKIDELRATYGRLTDPQLLNLFSLGPQSLRSPEAWRALLDEGIRRGFPFRDPPPDVSGRNAEPAARVTTHGFTDSALGRAYSRLGQAIEEMLPLRNRFEPIYRYYIPKSWLLLIARQLRFATLPEMSRYLPDLREIKAEARRIVTTATSAFEEIGTLTDDVGFRQLVELQYRQVYYDGTTMILFTEFISGMDQGDPSCKQYAVAMREIAPEARVNLRKLKAATLALRRRARADAGS